MPTDPQQTREDDLVDIRVLAIRYTSAIATAGRLADELDDAVNDLNELLDRRAEVGEYKRERRDPNAEMYKGKERRRDR